jgi:hypothetical protein
MKGTARARCSFLNFTLKIFKLHKLIFEKIFINIGLDKKQ